MEHALRRKLRSRFETAVGRLGIRRRASIFEFRVIVAICFTFLWEDQSLFRPTLLQYFREDTHGFSLSAWEEHYSVREAFVHRCNKIYFVSLLLLWGASFVWGEGLGFFWNLDLFVFL